MNTEVTKTIKRLIENAVISAFSLKQPRKTAFEYCNVEYIVEVTREKYTTTSVNILMLSENNRWVSIATNTVNYDYAPQYVVNVLTNNK